MSKDSDGIGGAGFFILPVLLSPVAVLGLMIYDLYELYQIHPVICILLFSAICFGASKIISLHGYSIMGLIISTSVLFYLMLSRFDWLWAAFITIGYAAVSWFLIDLLVLKDEEEVDPDTYSGRLRSNLLSDNESSGGKTKRARTQKIKHLKAGNCRGKNLISGGGSSHTLYKCGSCGSPGCQEFNCENCGFSGTKCKTCDTMANFQM